MGPTVETKHCIMCSSPLCPPPHHSSASVYYCECKQKVKMREAWERCYVSSNSRHMYFRDAHTLSLCVQSIRIGCLGEQFLSMASHRVLARNLLPNGEMSSLHTAIEMLSGKPG